ncbi:MAG: hypothetical protein ACKVTZ_00630 [Bacteroidia bacterium]
MFKSLVFVLLTGISASFPLITRPQAEKVMICDNHYKGSYHKTKCKGLDKCTKEIIWVSLEEAIKRKKDDPCNWCYGYTK